MNKELIETETKLADEKSQPKIVSSGPGKRLHAARIAANLPIEAVAMALHLTTQMVTNLEDDDYSSFAGHTFIRGYLRNYARLLNLSPDEIIACFNKLEIAEQASDKPKLSLKTTYRRRHLNLLKLLIIMGSLVGGLILIFAATATFKYLKTKQPQAVSKPAHTATQIPLAMPTEKVLMDDLAAPSAMIAPEQLLKNAQRQTTLSTTESTSELKKS